MRAGRRLMAVWLLAGLFWACQQDELSKPPDERHIAATVAMAQSYHAQVDIALEQGERREAKAALEALVEALTAADMQHPVVGDLALDAHGRLARLWEEEGEVDLALAVIERGLSSAGPRGEQSVFAGYLLQMRGDLLRSQGDDLGAVEAHRQAILIFKSILERQREE